jgi:predicted DsbA family dithiol-disulfide isomerase
MRVEIWSDLVCPWCYIGKRRFERAVASFPDRANVAVVHRSFQLDPTMPRGSAFDQQELLMKKYGLSPAEAKAMGERMARLFADEGLAFKTGGTRGSTFDGHRLVHLAAKHSLQDAVIERLYRAHFAEQRSIFDIDALVDLGAEAGLDRAEARRSLETDAYADAVQADQDDARQLGITGVPFFLIDRRLAISGAQAVDVFTQALAQGGRD